MKTLQLTDAEFAQLQHAVTMLTDMTVDTWLDETGLFVTDGEHLVVDSVRSKVIRDELESAHRRILAVHSLALKVGLKLNENGYVT